MPEYRRAFRSGGTFFFTVVTYNRAPFLCEPLSRQLLHEAIDTCRTERPFEINAFVLLPDHLHAIWTLPEEDSDFSTRWGVIKKSFTQAWTKAGGWEGKISDSRLKNQRRGVWQRRFWEHAVRDASDLEKHLNYIHFNPVKHWYCRCPHQWRWTSFHRLVKNCTYSHDWCCGCNGKHVELPDFSSLDETAME